MTGSKSSSKMMKSQHPFLYLVSFIQKFISIFLRRAKKRFQLRKRLKTQKSWQQCGRHAWQSCASSQDEQYD